MEVEALRQILAAELDHEYMEVEGDGRHFYLTVVSGAFRGLGRVQQHQLIYQVLGDLMKEDVHALVIKAYTPEDWAKQD